MAVAAVETMARTARAEATVVVEAEADPGGVPEDRGKTTHMAVSGTEARGTEAVGKMTRRSQGAGLSLYKASSHRDTLDS